MGAWLGGEMALYVFFFAAMATSVLSVVLLARQGGLARVTAATNLVLCQLYRFKVVAKHIAGVESVEAIKDAPDRRRRLIPFAAMMAGAVIAIVVWKSIYPS